MIQIKIKYFITVILFFQIISCNIQYSLTNILHAMDTGSGGGSGSKLTSFTENFEDGNISDWQQGSEYPAYNFTIVNVSSIPITGIPPTSSKCLQVVTNGTSSTMEGIYKYTGEFSPAYISLYMRFDVSSPGSSFCFMLSSDHNYAKRRIYIDYNFDGTNSYINFNNSSVGCNVNQWYFIELRNIDWTAKTFDVYVDSSFQFSKSINATLYTGSFNCLDIYCTIPNNPKCFIDDIYMH